MIRLAILKQSGSAGAAVPLIADDTGLFEIVLEDSSAKPSPTLTRDVSLAAPEVILLDVAAWPGTKDLLGQLKKSSKNAAFIGYSPGCTPEDAAAMEAAGIGAFLRAPFSA